MWERLANFILKFRIPLLAILLTITAGMGYMIQFTEMSWHFVQIVPDTDPQMKFYKEFRARFGEDANALAVGLKDSSVFELDNFKRLDQLAHDIEKIDGVTQVLSFPTLQYLAKDAKAKKFVVKPLFEQMPSTQKELDSLLSFAQRIKFFENRLFNPDNGATLLFVNYDSVSLNSKGRNQKVFAVEDLGNAFTADTGIDLHYAGLPYIRSKNNVMIREEMNLFLIVSIVLTAVILFAFFRSFSPVLYSLLVVGMVITWVMGINNLFGYKLTVLSALLPPVLVVISIPNCIYMLNKYHQEFAKIGDKRKALVAMIKKIGIVALITNTTTGIGFFVLFLTDIVLLQEFGLVAALSIMGAYFISIIFIPIVFSFLPAPESRHTRHLDFQPTVWLMEKFNHIVLNHRKAVYAVSSVLVVLGVIGMYQVEAVSFMLDDVPDESKIVKDLDFFEENFMGVMPLEVVVNTGKKQGVRKPSNLKLIDEFEEALADVPYITPPVSLVNLLKASNQAYFDQNPYDYRLPSRREQPYIMRYLKKNAATAGDDLNLASSFVDTTGQIMRISMKVKDMGSKDMKAFLDAYIQPRIDSVFGNSEVKAEATGATLLFIKGNQFLIDNLKYSMLIAFLLIAVIMGALFNNVRIILISLVPNIIPLLITAGLMGYFDIHLKPSTALVFSIVFGISVDDSIHFLARYRQELIHQKFHLAKAIHVSLRETGTSMMYTSIVLFFGFVAFTFSDFGGTKALGALTSITLLVAMVTNLVLLPCLLHSFDVSSRHLVRASGDMLNDYDGIHIERKD